MIGKTQQRLIILCLALVSACSTNPADKDRPEAIAVDVSKPIQRVKIVRFDQDLYHIPVPPTPGDVAAMRKKHGRFFELWCGQLSGIILPTDTAPKNGLIAYNLGQYLSDQHIQTLMADCDSVFRDLTWLEDQLTLVFERYRSGFQGHVVPKVITFVEPFNYKVMAMDSATGLGLHYYLGSNYKYYPSLQLPQYMVRKMSREYMVHDLIKGWLDSEYLVDSIQRNCLSQMIYQGKVMYAMDVLDPGMPDTIKTGYSALQFEWALRNEYDLWAFFVGQKLLYNTNPKVYLKFIHDGNTTSGFPKEAPARLGPFVGWKIVRAYMAKHADTSLKQLFELQDAQKILQESGYNPEKPSS
jgi:hypothetical protein